MTGKQLAKGALLLTATGLILRLIGFFYRIYISNMIGNEGMGLIQLVYPVYSLIFMTLTSGISTAVSKLTAQSDAVEGNSPYVLKSGIKLIFIIGIPLGIILLSASNYISLHIIKDARTLKAFRLLCVVLPFVASSTILRGYFYGKNKVAPSAISQLIEQSVKVIIAMCIFGKMIPKGLDYACLAVIIASVTGEIFSFITLGIVFLVKTSKKRDIIEKIKHQKSILNIGKIALPISVNKLISSLLMTAEVILIPRRLQLAGLDYSQGMDLFGRFTGMAMPLVMAPAIFTSSLATMLVPSITRDVKRSNNESVKAKICKAIQLTMVIGFLFSAVFNGCAFEFGELLFSGKNVGEVIKILSWACIFTYLNQTLAGIMNGINKQTSFMWNSMIGCAVRIIFVYFLIPIKGITIYVWGISASYALTAILNLISIVKTTGIRVDFRNWIFKPGLVFLAMLATGEFITSFLSLIGVYGRFHLFTVIAGTACIGLMMMFGVGAVSFTQTIRMLGIKKPGKA